MFEKIALGGCLALGLIIVLAVVIALPIMWLWNWLCPELFGLPVITFTQALGLYALTRCFTPVNASCSTS